VSHKKPEESTNMNKKIDIRALTTFFCFNSFFVRIVLNVNIKSRIVSIKIIEKNIPSTSFEVKSLMLPTSTHKLLKNVRSAILLEFKSTNVRKAAHTTKVQVRPAQRIQSICFNDICFFILSVFFLSPAASFKKSFSHNSVGIVFDKRV